MPEKKGYHAHKGQVNSWGESIVHSRNGDSRGAPERERPPFFGGIPPGEYSKISAAARFREFARGEMLYAEGDAVREVLLLDAGSAKISKTGANSAKVMLRLGMPGDILGAVGLFSTARHCDSAYALRGCRALVWDAPTFERLIQRYPHLHETMSRILGEYALELQERFQEVATERVGPRLARQLVRLHQRIGRPVNGEIEVGLSREELAQMTGTTLFTVSRLLSAWEARGWVRSRREVVIVCDIPSLRVLSNDGRGQLLASTASGYNL